MPATSKYIRGFVADWARMPHIGGAYSHPSLGAHVGDREALAAPVGKILFFAGEATHSAVNPCLQAAMETGVRAAAEVVAATGERSRL
jgi:monoamine oxidase